MTLLTLADDSISRWLGRWAFRLQSILARAHEVIEHPFCRAAISSAEAPVSCPGSIVPGVIE